MEIALEILGLILMLTGVLGSILPVVPGAPLSFAGAFLIAWSRDFSLIGWPALTMAGMLAIFSLLVDFIASVLGAKRCGASRLALAGSALGAVFGMLWGIPGVIIGPFAGAIMGELASGGKLKQAWNVGLAAWTGMLLGGAIKAALSMAMVAIIAFAYFF